MPNINFNYVGKVVLITGSSSGIGAATAILFARAGADVVITGRNAEKLSEVAKVCQKVSQNNSKILQVLADVTKEEDCNRIVDSTIKEFGKLDILVNNAGYVDNRFITEPDYMDVCKNVMKTNLFSTIYLTHLCVEHLAKSKGNIINNSSVAGIISGKRVSAYCMSKSAMDMFTRCMATELGAKGIRVNSVNPGVVKTSILDFYGFDKDTTDALFDTYGKLYPIGRSGVGEDIANSILFLASDEAAFLTGTVMLADGGHVAANVNLGHDMLE